MAEMTPPPHSYLVLKDNLVFPKGSLVEFRSGSYYYHSHIWTYVLLDPLDPISFEPHEVAPLTEEECVLLDAIGASSNLESEDDAARHTLYGTPGRLAWGVGLRVGDFVLARLPCKRGCSAAEGGGSGEERYANAVIRSIGVEERDFEEGGERALFGVEITVSLS